MSLDTGDNGSTQALEGLLVSLISDTTVQDGTVVWEAHVL
jgi:hypothetical protein